MLCLKVHSFFCWKALKICGSIIVSWLMYASAARVTFLVKEEHGALKVKGGGGQHGNSQKLTVSQHLVLVVCGLVIARNLCRIRCSTHGCNESRSLRICKIIRKKASESLWWLKRIRNFWEWDVAGHMLVIYQKNCLHCFMKKKKNQMSPKIQ